MIQIKKIEPPLTLLFAPDNTMVGELNEYEFMDALIQIKNGQLKGYYTVFNGRPINIDKNGRLESYPNGLLDTMSNLYAELL